MGENRDDQWIPPSILVIDAINDLKSAKQSYLMAADEIDNSINILETGKPYWDQIDPGPFLTMPSGIASVQVLIVMANQAHMMMGSADEAHRLAHIMNSTSGSFGTATTTAATVVCQVASFDPYKISKVIEKPQNDEEYTRKLMNLDPELGRLYGQILQVRRRTTYHPEKSILPDIRQAYDHLMRILAPDDEVRKQPSWRPVDLTKPDMVTRKQRLEYAAIKHIHDETYRTTILASTNHILAVHDDLNELYHIEKPIDVDQAYSVSEAMTEVLNQWADALGL